MKLETLKELLNNTTGVSQVFFQAPDVTAIDRDKMYPYVIWDVRGLKSVLQWQNTSQIIEEVTIKAYILGEYDKNANNNPQSIENKWDELRANFRTYLTALLTSQYLTILNLNKMPTELFDIGVTLDSEIGVSFDVDFRLYCNL